MVLREYNERVNCLFFTTGSRMMREIFFTTERNGRKKNGKGTEKDEEKEEEEGLLHIFFLYRAAPDKEKRMSILDNT